MPSFNLIFHTADPITDTQADTLVGYLEAYSPVVDGDGVITVTVTKQPTQNHALAHAMSLVFMFDFVVITQVEAMTTEAYDEVYTLSALGN